MKRTVFRNPWLPYALVFPQLLVTLVFFFWPAGKSLYLSLFKSAPFGGRDVFVGLENFTQLLTTPEYYDSVINSFVFAVGVTALSVGGGLVVAALANQKVRGLALYRTALLWPYGIRDWQNIGHKAIFAAHSWRTLELIGWEHEGPDAKRIALPLWLGKTFSGYEKAAEVAAKLGAGLGA